MKVIAVDVAIVGAGGAGLRAAIAAAEADSTLKILLVSKVYPMRSHTVAAEGGSAGVVQPHDSLEHHFNDTVTGGDWLCDQDVVEYFVAALHPGDGCSWTIGVAREPQAGWSRHRARFRRYEDRAHRGLPPTTHRLPYAPHSVPDVQPKIPNRIKRLRRDFCTICIVEAWPRAASSRLDIASGRHSPHCGRQGGHHRNRRRRPRIATTPTAAILTAIRSGQKCSSRRLMLGYFMDVWNKVWNWVRATG